MHISRSTIFNFIAVLLLVFLASSLYGQEDPPRPLQVQVETARWLNFGAFTSGVNGGTVNVNFDGSRTATGDVGLLHFGTDPSSALFDVFAIPGAVVRIQTPTGVTLTGSNGGTIVLNINSFSTGEVFVHTGTPNNPTPVEVGGTLEIGSSGANPPGHYEGTFTLTFINE